MNERIMRGKEVVVVTAAQVRDFLHTPAGRQLRRYLAVGIIITSPLLFRIPGLRRYPLIRMLEAVGGAALLIKLAEAIRDWEREGERDDVIVLDVGSAPQ